MEARHSRMSSDDFILERKGEVQNRSVLGMALQPRIDLAAGRIQTSPGIRLDLYHDRFHGTLPFENLPTEPATTDFTAAPTLQLGVGWRLGDHVDLKSNLGYATRVPTLLEKFGMRGMALGNPDLKAEHGINTDVGIICSRPRFGHRFQLTLFRNLSRDLISFQPINPVTSKPFNIGKAEIRGMEIDLQLQELDLLSFSTNFTRLSALDRTDNTISGGKQLPGRPGHEIRMDLGLHLERLSRPIPLQLGYGLSALGDNFAESGERSRIPGRVLHEIRARWHQGLLTFHLRLENLGNAQVFDLWGYPLPGRNFIVSITMGGHVENR